jgi:hypothetical protein
MSQASYWNSPTLYQDFEILILAAAVELLAGCFLEKTPLGDAMLRSMDRFARWNTPPY